MIIRIFCCSSVFYDPFRFIGYLYNLSGDNSLYKELQMSWCGCFYPTASAWEHVTQFSIKTNLWVAKACLLCTEACPTCFILFFFFVTPLPQKPHPQKYAVNQTVLHLNAASPSISDSPSPSVVGLCRCIKDFFLLFRWTDFGKIHSSQASPDMTVGNNGFIVLRLVQRQSDETHCSLLESQKQPDVSDLPPLSLPALLSSWCMVGCLLPRLKVHRHGEPSGQGQHLRRGKRQEGIFSGHSRKIHPEHSLRKAP